MAIFEKLSLLLVTATVTQKRAKHQIACLGRTVADQFRSPLECCSGEHKR
jgi:hypothetical protein